MSCPLMNSLSSFISLPHLDEPVTIDYCEAPKLPQTPGPPSSSLSGPTKLPSTPVCLPASPCSDLIPLPFSQPQQQ